MKKVLFIAACVLISVMTNAQQWQKAYHPADEMLDKPAWTEYTYKAYDFKLWFKEDSTTIDGDVVITKVYITPEIKNEKLYDLIQGDVLIGYYNKNDKFLSKYNGNYYRCDHSHTLYIPNGGFVNYLLKNKGYVRFVFPNGADIKIPCFNNN